jgi:hypothetical protein
MVSMVFSGFLSELNEFGVAQARPAQAFPKVRLRLAASSSALQSRKIAQAFPKLRPRMAAFSSALQSRTIASFPKSAATDGRFFFGSAITDDCKS